MSFECVKRREFTSEGQEGGRRHVLVYLGNSHRKGKRFLEYLMETTQIFAAEVVKKEEESRTNIA